ncbi:CLUMA_CG021004, isoform A [Clunio marinus]|uniref:CLUMA_CG021004, isoform A n=1 Tax=Clunio marinus TaxID=568069 RepID=A0A1J1J8V1_9DIPT|nr:CLUMA_CG021004, isoform A [Clunio marinus]
MGGRRCAVVGCKSRTVKKGEQGVHFYRIPKEQPWKDIWTTFTRRGSDFEVKKFTSICHEHFAASAFDYKKKLTLLQKNAVPTIFKRDTLNGLETVVLTFDRSVLHYVETDTLLNPAYDKEKRIQEILEKRNTKLKEILQLCRFCSDSGDGFLQINTLKDYSINPTEMMNLLGIASDKDIFSNLTCEECFQQIIIIDGYRKRCQRAQHNLNEEIKVLDVNLEKISKMCVDGSSWMKTETWDDDDDDADDDYFLNDINVRESEANSKEYKQEQDFHEIILKEEGNDVSSSDANLKDFLTLSDENLYDHITGFEQIETLTGSNPFCDTEMKSKKATKSTAKSKTPKKTKGINETCAKITLKVVKVKNETMLCQESKQETFGHEQRIIPMKKRPHNLKTYECFFCGIRFDGQDAWRRHDCQQKILRCEIENCGKSFVAISGFNQHIQHLHKLPKLSRFFCASCKVSMVRTEEDFKKHLRECENNVISSASCQPITCEICGKLCPSQKSFAVHLLFHKNGETYTPPKKWKPKKKGIFMCDSCGKSFEYARNLREHIQRMHKEPDPNPIIYTCDFCGKTRTNRRLLSKHIRNVHTSQPTPCRVCGKIFRNKPLLQAHMIYHKDYKRIHFCPMCPEKPPYVTAVALKRHQESAHGLGQGYQCEICLETFRTTPGLSNHKNTVHNVYRYKAQGYAKEYLDSKNLYPGGSSTICEVHFKKECFVEKKDRVHLSKTAVPTIFIRPTSLIGLEMSEVPYDEVNHQYYGQQSIDLLQNKSSDKEEEEEVLLTKRQQKLDEVKSLCRFCFSFNSKDDRKCVPMSKLESYSIDLKQFMTFLELSLETKDNFGNLVCEQCFQQIVEIDMFKKKCKQTYDEVYTEIQEIENKILEVRATKSNNKSWFHNDLSFTDFEQQNDPQTEAPTSIEILEEHLVEDSDFDDDYNQYAHPSTDNQTMPIDHTDDLIEEIHDGYKVIYQQIPEENICNNETILEESLKVCDQDINIQVLTDDNVKQEKLKEIPQGVDVYDIGSTDDIIKNPERNRFCFRIYECFFCKMKFAGRKTYVAHKCSVTEVKCEQCEKVFNRIQSYNSHVSHVHGSLPVSKHFCPLCKTVIMATLNQFKQHRRQCNKEVKNQPIECEVCGKVCNNLKGYTIHKLFHDTRNFTTSSGEKIVSQGLNVYKGLAICELCGKDFQSSVGYRMHKRNVHRIGQAEDETFQCHVCSKICPTKRSLFDHMRNTHRVQHSQCNVCNKIFRTKVLLKKHMIYHDETKRIYKCKLCPDKPGYFTNVALKRHQKSHVGSRDYRCDFPLCESAYTTNHQLKLHKINKHASIFN